MEEIKIEKDDSFTQENLLNIILTNNKEALKNLISEIYRVVCINCETYDRSQKISLALEAADLTEYSEYEELRKKATELYETNIMYNNLRLCAEKALEKLN